MNPAAPNAFSWVLWILGGLGATIAVAILWQRALACHRRTRKVLREDALKALYHITARGEPASIQNLAGALYLTQDQSASLIADLERHQDVSHSGGHLHLTDRGRAGALRVIRAHRLWESHLAEETSVAEAHWHSQADRKEHLLSPTEADALAARLGHPTHDPHGDPIPTRQGQVAAIAGRPLTAAAPGQLCRVLHPEDEPATIYAELVEAGLRAGMVVSIVDQAADGIRVLADARPCRLTAIAAQNVTVIPLSEEESREVRAEATLAQLSTGEIGVVLGLTRACRSVEQRRLLDLGFTPGTTVATELVSPTGGAKAYRLRGTLIALREAQANLVRVRRQPESA